MFLLLSVFLLVGGCGEDDQAVVVKGVSTEANRAVVVNGVSSSIATVEFSLPPEVSDNVRGNRTRDER